MANSEKSVLKLWTSTNYVWQKIHINFTGPIKNYHFLVSIDSFSKWVEVFKINEQLPILLFQNSEIFSRFSISHTNVSDNGRQFVSEEFNFFTSNNKIKHVLTTLGHPATITRLQIS